MSFDFGAETALNFSTTPCFANDYTIGYSRDTQLLYWFACKLDGSSHLTCKLQGTYNTTYPYTACLTCRPLTNGMVYSAVSSSTRNKIFLFVAKGAKFAVKRFDVIDSVYYDFINGYAGLVSEDKHKKATAYFAISRFYNTEFDSVEIYKMDLSKMKIE